MVKNNDAVSPVIGVMLMLVVTIIIAALVSAFAGGLGTDRAKAPDIQIKFVGPVLTDGYQSLEFEHAGGESIDMEDLRLALICGVNQIEIGWLDYFAPDSALNPGAAPLETTIKGTSAGNGRYQIVGVPSRSPLSGAGDSYLRTGYKFRVYADEGADADTSFMTFKCYRREFAGSSSRILHGSISLEYDTDIEYVLTDRKSGQILTKGSFMVRK